MRVVFYATCDVCGRQETAEGVDQADAPPPWVRLDRLALPAETMRKPIPHGAMACSTACVETWARNVLDTHFTSITIVMPDGDKIYLPSDLTI